MCEEQNNDNAKPMGHRNRIEIQKIPRKMKIKMQSKSGI